MHICHRGKVSGFFFFFFCQVRQGLKEYSNWPTYPQVYVKGELIGGLDIIAVRTVNCINQTIKCVDCQGNNV